MTTTAVRCEDGTVYLYPEDYMRYDYVPTEDEREEMFNGYGDHGPLSTNRFAL